MESLLVKLNQIGDEKEIDGMIKKNNTPNGSIKNSKPNLDRLILF